MKHILLATVATLWATASLAHGPDKGPNGGVQVDAGSSHHIELVAKDTTLAVYIYDRNDKPIDAHGAKATGIFVIDGKSQRIELKPDGVNRLAGSAPTKLPPSPKGAVQVTLPDGQSLQAKF
jgi:hypothetical protein